MSTDTNPNPRKPAVFRYDKHMPKTDDLSLIVLKGHLLVEEALYALADSALPHPQHLKKINNLPFATLAHVIRAAVPQNSEDVCWQLIFKLNSLRNDFAHELEPPDLQTDLQKLFSIDERVKPWPGMPTDKSCERSLDDAQRLRIVIRDCMTFLVTLDFDYQRNSKPKTKAQK